MTRLTALAICCATLLPAAAQAQELCGKAQSTLALRECWGEELARADAALNDSYATARDMIATGFPGDEALATQTNDQLRDAQRAWITMRDNDCTVTGNAYKGGSLEPMIVTICLHAATIARTQTLDSIAAEYSDQ